MKGIATDGAPASRKWETLPQDSSIPQNQDGTATDIPLHPPFLSIAHNRLFHAGKIAIITGDIAPHSLSLIVVGLPARGKTHLSVSLARYLKWSPAPRFPPQRTP